MTAAVLALLCATVCVCACLSLSLAHMEIDVSWDFSAENDASLGGWANGTAEVTGAEARTAGGELRCSLTSRRPFVESPSLFLHVTPAHYLVLRARYDGLATQARLLLRSGGAASANEQLHSRTSHWSSRQRTLAINATNALVTLSQNVSQHSQQAAVDEDPYTYFESANGRLSSVTLDLQSSRQITSVRVLPFADSSSPRRMVLLKSLTSGVGPFEKVISFSLSPPNNSTNPHAADSFQEFSGFSAYARYWRVLFFDNYGGATTRVRELSLDGFDESVSVVPFTLDTSGAHKMYYLPLGQTLHGTLLKMRIELLYPEYATPALTATQTHTPPYTTNTPLPTVFREMFAIDYVRVARAPRVWKTRGCVDKYYETESDLLADDYAQRHKSPDTDIDTNTQTRVRYNVTTHVQYINSHLPLTSFTQHALSLPFAVTYDCPREGGVAITIEGENFGDAPVVTVQDRPCAVLAVRYIAPLTHTTDNNTNTRSDPHALARTQEITCRLPSGLSSGPQRVRIANGRHPGLFSEYHGRLAYRTAPPVPRRPTVTNIGARRVDLVWAPPVIPVDIARTVTGYKIIWFSPRFPLFVSNMTVGNVTTTSVRGLEPASEYVFAVAAMSEGIEHANAPTDLYGRRDPRPGALLGEFSLFTNVTATLAYDFDFSFFNANQTLNSSALSSLTQSDGPTGQFGAEGAYGLVLVGSANIQNCNVSSTCCDGYNASVGVSSCGAYRSVCAVLSAYMLAYDKAIDGVTRRGVPSNLPYSNGAPAEIMISTLDELIANKGAELPSSPCGPALRLTPAEARSSGSMWYRRKMNVREGFDTTIRFQISNPSQKCDRMDDVNTYCRSRGADGLAFVIQNVAPDALGKAGSGLGYEGIDNALAVELDTYHNYDQMDFYENHISVMTQGFRLNITANHSRSLATTNRIPDLTDGIHTVRIKYDPNFDANAVPHQSFQVTGFTTWFLNNADFPNGGEADWGTGFGLLYVYLDDMYSPVITTPLNLGATLELDDGRSYVGVTAATGDQYWQAHDILSWQFTSLFIDEDYQPPLVVNGEGAHRCVNETACVHPVDYEHYTRKNSAWGKGADNTEGWMTGKDGFCAFC